MAKTYIKRELTRGVYYSAVAKYSGVVISIVVVAILSRLIAPEEFGIVAVATVLINFLTIIGNLGIGSAVIQHKELGREELNHIFTFTVWVALALGLLLLFGADAVASYYNSEKVGMLFKLLGISFFFTVINSVPNHLFYRDKKFKFLAYRTLAIQLVAGLLAVIAALKGAGIYALLVNPLFSSIALFIVSIVKYPQRFKVRMRMGPIKIIFAYSSYLFLFELVNYFVRNLDKLMIGRSLNMEALGYYEKSYRVMMLPLQNINHVIGPVLHPIFSDYREEVVKLRGYYGKMIKMLALIGFPLSIFSYFASSEIILLLFGGNWVNSIPSFQILSLSIGIQIVLSTSGAIFQSRGSTKQLLLSGLLSSICSLSALFVAIYYFGTIEAVAWSVTLSFTINFFQSFFILYRYVLRSGLTLFLKELLSPLALTAIVLVVFLLLRELLSSIDSLLLSFILKTAIYLSITYLYLNKIEKIAVLKEGVAFLKGGRV